MVTIPGEQAAALKLEADQLLSVTGLHAILMRHGEVFFTGSYFYDLMTWRDIDVCVAVTGKPMRIAAEITGRICRSCDIASVYIRNEHVLKTEGNPRAVFVCLEYLPSVDKLWKVDILLGSPEIVSETIAPGRSLVSRLTPEIREAILLIKSELCKTSDYRRRIKSTDVYRAVIENGVRDMGEWEEWWRTHCPFTAFSNII